MTPGPMTGTSFPAMTPRTLAFTRLDSGSQASDLPLRHHFSTPNPGGPLHLHTGGGSMSGYAYQEQPQPQMYFPPPPTQAAKYG